MDGGSDGLDLLQAAVEGMAFTLVDVETEVPQAVIDQLAAIHGVLRVRYLPG